MSEEAAPALTLTIIRDDAPFEIKMTYGLEMDLRRVLPDPGIAMQLGMVDSETQDYIIRRCLTDSKKMIKDENELVAVEAVNISTEDIDAIILWVVEHQLYFFGKRARAMMTLAARQKTKAPQLLTNDGSVDLASETPSAGPSESSKETSMDSTGDMPVES